MEEQKPRKAIRRWMPNVLRHILNQQPLADPKMFREQVVGQIDDRGLTLTQAAALHALDNTEEVKKQLGDLLTPRPGERLNLDRILTLLEKWRNHRSKAKSC